MLGLIKGRDLTGLDQELLKKCDLRKRHDRVGKYLKKHLDRFVFDEFSQKYLKSQRDMEFMAGIPIPLRKEDLKEFQGGAGLQVVHIVENMAWIMGIDPKFKHNDTYIAYMQKYFKVKIVESLLKEGRNDAENEEYDSAAIHLRAALLIDPTNLDAMYSYARVCRELYQASNNEERTGVFKAEAMEYFEFLVEIHPQYAQAYYYLGYAYLNLGLYVKAQLTWQDFIAKSKNRKDKQEVKMRLEQLRDPVEIEKGYSEILATRWQNGIDILEPYLKTRFKEWWPMSYYLGVGYMNVGRNSDAIASFKRTLSINPSHVESMDELAKLYGQSKDKENEQKYLKKAELIRSGGHK